MGWSVNRPTGLTFHRAGMSTKGYTLLTPHGDASAYLIDIDGRVVYRWTFRHIRPSYGRLLPNGNLLMTGSDVNLPEAASRRADQGTAASGAARDASRWLPHDAARSGLGRQTSCGSTRTVSARSNDRVAVISAETGDIVFKFTETHKQHNPTWVEGGNIQVFDNGHDTSRLVEIDPASGEVVWEYHGEPAYQFFSGHISGASRLESGNVLVCEGTSGRLFEVTRDHQVVWEWINPFTNYRRGKPTVSLYRAHRYGVDFPGLSGRDLDPARHANVNQLHGLV